MQRKICSRDPVEVSIGRQGLAAIRRSKETAASNHSSKPSPEQSTSLTLNHSRPSSRLSRSDSESSIRPTTPSNSDSETSNRSCTRSSTTSRVSSRTSINSPANALMASEVLANSNTNDRSHPPFNPCRPRITLNLTIVKENLPSCTLSSQQPQLYFVKFPPLCETTGADRYRCYKNQPKSTKMKYVLEKMGSTVDICAMLNPNAEVRGFDGLTYHDLLRMKYTKEIREVCREPTEEISPEGVLIVHGFQSPSDLKEKDERIKKVLYPHRYGDHTNSSCRNLNLVHNHYPTDETAIPLDLLSSPSLFTHPPSPRKYVPKRRRPLRRSKQVDVVSPTAKASTRKVRWKDEVEQVTAGAPEPKKGGNIGFKQPIRLSSGAVLWQTLKE